MPKVRVLVVDDSLVARSMIIQGLNASGNIEVVGYAINSIDAKQKVIKLKPDVMTCDVQMPGMNGIDFLKELLPQYPVPTVLVSSLNLGVFDALHAGAVDFVRKPDGTESPEQFLRSLALKVVVAAKAQVRGVRAAEPTLAPPCGAQAGAEVPDFDRAGCVDRRDRGDARGDETVARRHPGDGDCAAHADRFYENVCRAA